MKNFAEYQPNEAVLKTLHAVPLIAVVGVSGSGKTTLVNMVTRQDPRVHVVVSDISRARRPEERDGVDYFFKSKADMLAAIDRREYVQIAPSNSGDMYATHVENYVQIAPNLITVWADAMPVFKALPFKSLRTVYIVPASYAAWQKQLGLHNFNPELHQKRLAEAERSLTFALQEPDVEFIINDDLPQTARDFLEIIHRPIHAPKPDQMKARAIVRTILDELRG